MDDATPNGVSAMDAVQRQFDIPTGLEYDQDGIAQRHLIYGTAWKGDRTADLVYQAVEAGFRAFATAAQPKHYREHLVGEAIRRAISEGIVSRENLFIQTTFTPYYSQDPDDLPYAKDEDPVVQAQTSIEASLATFHDPVSGQTYLDAVILHTPYPDSDTTVRVLRAISAAFAGPGGRVRRLGISNVTAAELEDLRARGVGLDIVQNRCHYADGLDREVRRLCRAHHIEYQAFGALRNPPLLRDDSTVLAVAREIGVSHEVALYALVMVALGDEDHTGNLEEDVKVLDGTTQEEHMREDLEQVKRALCALKDAALSGGVMVRQICDQARPDMQGKAKGSGIHPTKRQAQLHTVESGLYVGNSTGDRLRQAMWSFRAGLGER